MSTATITALAGGITGVIVAVTGLVALFVHTRNHP